MLNKETLFIFVAILLGFVNGIFFPEFSKKIKIIGDIFLILLKLMVIPLVFVSITGSIVNLRSIEKFKRIGILTLILYFSTMFLAVITGIAFIYFLKAGVDYRISNSDFSISAKTLDEFLLGFFPSNIFKSMVDGNILQVIFFSVLIGLAILKLGKNLDEVSNFWSYLFELIMIIVRWIISITPIGVFCIISNMVANIGFDVFFSLYRYVLAVVGGIIFHGFVVLPLLMWFFTNYNPYFIFAKVVDPLMVAFSTCSSSATLPVSIRFCIDRLQLNRDIVEFVLPLGATVNMNGTALYEAVAAIFVANVFGINLGLVDYLVISITSVFAAIGAAAIPGAGLVTMSIVFTAVGIPLEGIGLIVVVDRFLDMFRTAINVWGDIAVAFIVSKKIS